MAWLGLLCLIILISIMEDEGHHIHYKGNHKGSRGTTRYYACSKYQGTLCSARLVVCADGQVVVEVKHTCRATVNAKEVDVREEMKRLIEER